MQPARLKHFDDFADLAPPDLAVLARAARCFKLPAGRWLVRPGRSLPDRYYLLSGRVNLLQGGRPLPVAAPSPRSRQAVYPGVAGVETLSAAEFLSVAPALLEELAGAAQPLGVPRVDGAEATWQRRFLTSPLMARLPPAVWQRVLGAMSRHEFAAGEWVLGAGEPATCCYVLTAGAADIIGPGDEILATLGPGALFGEEALLRGGGRNASVRMTQCGGAVSLPAACFEAWLVEAVTPCLEALDDRRLLSIEASPPADGLHVPLDRLRSAARALDGAGRYAVAGGSLRQRRLAAFLLAEQGVDARPLAG